MTEARFQSRLLKSLRQHPVLKDGIVVKLSDRFTSGLPDVMVSTVTLEYGRYVTTFFELKVWPNKMTKIQRYYFNRMKAHLVTLYKNGDIFVGEFVGNFPQAVEEIVRRCVN